MYPPPPPSDTTPSLVNSTKTKSCNSKQQHQENNKNCLTIDTSCVVSATTTTNNNNKLENGNNNNLSECPNEFMSSNSRNGLASSPSDSCCSKYIFCRRFLFEGSKFLLQVVYLYKVHRYIQPVPIAKRRNSSQ